MSNALLGYINYVTTGTVAANNAAANFPVTNLQNRQRCAGRRLADHRSGPGSF